MTDDEIRLANPELTPLEIRCLEGFWNRRHTKTTATELGVSESWVNKNLASARLKLGVNSSAEAAAIAFGGERPSVKNYYWQQTALPSAVDEQDQAYAAAKGFPVAAAISERALLNNLGVGQTIGLIFVVALALLMGLLLILQSAIGIDHLWEALGY